MSTFEELIIRDKSVSVHQNGIFPDIMNDIFRERNITYSTRNSSGFETKNIKTVHYGPETIAYLGPKIWDFVPQKIKDSEHIINIFKSNIKFWKSENCPCSLCKPYLQQS